jgi:hypothetical protein
MLREPDILCGEWLRSDAVALTRPASLELVRRPAVPASFKGESVQQSVHHLVQNCTLGRPTLHLIDWPCHSFNSVMSGDHWPQGTVDATSCETQHPKPEKGIAE